MSHKAEQQGSSHVGSGTLVRRVWFTMVLVPTKGWTRVGKAYGSEKSARGWLRLVSQEWDGLRTKTAQCTLRWKDGVMDERSRRTLSEKFNMEPTDVKDWSDVDRIGQSANMDYTKPS
jgi:hypothetical protein